MSAQGLVPHRRRFLGAIGLMAVAGLFAGAGSNTAEGIEAPLPLDPTTGQAALLGVVSSLPMSEIDAAKEHFPVPFVVVAEASGIGTTTTGRAGAPLRIDLDQSNATGQGGSDIVVTVDVSAGPTPGVSLTVQRLGSAPFVVDVGLTMVLPFEGFVPASAEGPASVVLGFDTGPEGQPQPLPPLALYSYIPGDLSGTARTSVLSHAIGAPPAQLALVAGHIHGSSDSGVTDYALYRLAMAGVPPAATATIGVEESADDAPLQSTFRLDWAANGAAPLVIDAIEDDDTASSDPDFATTLRIPDAPSDLTVLANVDEAGGTHGLSVLGAAPVGEFEIERWRSDGLRMTALGDLPSGMTLDGQTSGGFDLSASTPVAALALRLSEDDAFAGTGDILGRDVAAIDIDAVGLPSAAVSVDVSPGGTSRTVTVDSAAGPLSSLTLSISSDPVVTPLSSDLAPGSVYSSHAASLIDDGNIAGFGFRVADVTTATLELDPVEVEMSASFTDSESARELAVDLDLAASASAGSGIDLAVGCRVDSMPEGSSSFETDFVGSVSYSSDPHATLDSVSCGGTIGSLTTSFTLADVPAVFAFLFDPDASVQAVIGPPGSPDERMGSISWYIGTSDPAGLPGSGALFGTPLLDARVRLDDLPSMAAMWSQPAGLEVVASTVEPGLYFGGLQLDVSTVAGSTLPFGAAQSLGSHTIRLVDEAGAGELELALVGAHNVIFGHDGPLAAASLDAELDASLPMNLGLASLFGGGVSGLFDAECSFDPLPTGGVSIETDYATWLQLAAGPSTGLDSIDCTGSAAGLEFTTTLTGIPSQADVLLDPTSSFTVALSEPLGSVSLDVRDPSGLVPAAALLGVSVGHARLSATSVPSMTATWEHTPGGPGNTEVTITSSDATAVIGSIAVELNEEAPAPQVLAFESEAQVATPNCGLNLSTLPTSPASLSASIANSPFATFSIAPGGLQLNVFSAVAQACAINIATSYPTNPPSLSPQSLFTLGCLLDEAPAGQFTFTTNFISNYATNTVPPTRVDLFNCTGQNGTALFSNRFEDLPPTLALTLGSTSGVQLAANDAGNPSYVGQALVHVTTTDDQFGLVGTAALFGNDLRLLGVRLDDAPSTDIAWSMTPSIRAFSVVTTPVPGVVESLGGVQFVASGFAHDFLELHDPAAIDDEHVVRVLQTPNRSAQILEARLFGLSAAAFTEETFPPDPDDGPQAAETKDVNASLTATTAIPLSLFVSTVGPVADSDPEQTLSSTTSLLLNGEATSFTLASDLASNVEYVGNGEIETIDVELETSLSYDDPVAAADEGLVAPLPSQTTILLKELPTELSMNFEQEGEPGGESSALTVSVSANGPVGVIEFHSAGPDLDDTENALATPLEQSARLESLPESLSLEFTTSTTHVEDAPPVTDIAGLVYAVGPIGRVFVDSIDPKVAEPGGNRWMQIDVLDIPRWVQFSMHDDGRLLDVDFTGSDLETDVTTNDAIGRVRLVQSSALPGDAGPLMVPFTEGANGDPACHILTTGFADTIAERAYTSDLEGHIEDIRCTPFGLEMVGDDTTDHVVSSTVTAQEVADGGGPKLNDDDKPIVGKVDSFTSVQLSGLQSVVVELDREQKAIPSGDPEIPPSPVAGGHVVFIAPSVDPHPVFVGSYTNAKKAVDFVLVDDEQVMLALIENLPDELTVDIVALESVAFSANEGFGRVDVYSGPRGGAEDGQGATRLIIEDAPSAVTVNYDGIPVDPFADNDEPWIFDWSYVVDVDASSQFRILAGFQNEVTRTFAGFDAEDLHVDLSAHGVGFTPCDPLFDVDTCYGLLRVAADIDALGNVSEAGASGFLLVWSRIDDPEELDPVADAPGAAEYVPLVTLLAEDFESLSSAVEVQLDPLQPFADLYPIDIEFGLEPVFGDDGGVVFDFWDQAFEACFDPTPEDTENDDAACIDVSINGPDYIADNPWHLLPLLHGEGDHFDVLD